MSVRKNLELQDKQEMIGEAIEESVELLDVYYQRIDEKSKLEVFSDDHVVRELVNDISEARDAVLAVAHKLYASVEDDDHHNDEKVVLYE